MLNITPQGSKICASHRGLDAQILRRTVEELLESCSIEEFEAFVKVVRLRNQMLARQLDRREGDDGKQYFGC